MKGYGPHKFFLARMDRKVAGGLWNWWKRYNDATRMKLNILKLALLAAFVGKFIGVNDFKFSSILLHPPLPVLNRLHRLSCRSFNRSR